MRNKQSYLSDLILEWRWTKVIPLSRVRAIVFSEHNKSSKTKMVSTNTVFSQKAKKILYSLDCTILFKFH